MLENVIKDKKFAEIMQNSIQDIILHFFSSEQNFGILCKIEEVSFSPSLPETINAEFQELTLFFLAGYTFETARIVGGDLVFEAGFGADNFGSLVSVPLLSVMQIIVDETPILINLSLHKEEFSNENTPSSTGEKNSMASFLSNPENSKFVKK